MQVCSLHFKQSDYILPDFGSKGKRYLKKNAVPSCNLPCIDKKIQSIEAKNNNREVSESNRKRKSGTTCITQSSNKRRRKVLLVSPDEILEGDDKPGQSTSTDTSLSKSEEIQSEDEFIQGQTVEESVSTASPTNSRQSPRILKRKTQSNSKLQLNKSTDVNTSDVQAKNDVASSKPTRSKRQPVFSTRVQNTQEPKRKSPSKIQKRKSTDHVDDEFDIFSKDIAFQLRQLPYYNALQCQEKIKTIINQERFNAPQLHHQEIEKIIIKQEPGFSEEEPLQPVSSQETIQTIIKEEPVTSDDEYPHPVLGQVTIINQESAIKEDKLSGPVSCQEIINKKTTISEEEISHPVSGQEIMINKKSALREEEISNPVSSQETIQTRIYHIPPAMSSPLPVIKTEYVSCENEPVTSSIESVDLQ